jgi:pilus assembly protein Flp/PilA
MDLPQESADMKNLLLKMGRFLRCDEAATAVEYAAMVAFIVTACIASVAALGSATNQRFSNSLDQITGNS